MPFVNGHPIMIVQVVIPIFNRFEHLPRLLDQLAEQSLRPHRVVVVDHGTQSLVLKRSWPFAVEVIKRPSHLWFTAATNEGLAHVRQLASEFLMILNDDVSIECSHWLERLVELASAANTMVASAAIDSNRNVLYAGIKFQPLCFRYSFAERGRPLAAIAKDPVDCDVLPTRGILFRASVLETVGYLDDKTLPHHSSDYEWTARAKKHGIRLLMARDVQLVTERAGDALRRPFRQELSQYFFDRNLKGSFPVARAYSARLFRQPYRVCYLSAHFARFLLKCAGRRIPKL